MTGLPLEGIRVLEHGEALAGPFCVVLLSDAGAQCIKVESIQRSRGPVRPVPGSPGYADNDVGSRPWERSANSNHVNRGKLGITLDLTRPKGVALYKKLVSVSDVVLENFSAGTMERLGLGYEELKRVKPDLIMISMSGFGATGPYRGYASYGFNVDGIVGQTALRGYADEDPSQSVPSVQADAVSACNAAFAVMAALVYRQRTGKGQSIDLSQAEGMVPHLVGPVMDYFMNRRSGKRLGNRHEWMAPHGAYPCRGEDSWVAIAVSSDEEWRALCRVMGDPSWSRDPRFGDMLSRHRNQDELDKLISEWTREQDHYEVMHKLQQAGVPAGPFMKEDEAYSDPHLNARGFFEEKTHREAGTHRYPGAVWKFSKTPMSIHLLAPCLGEHNEHVFGGILGLSKKELAELEAEQYIGTDYLEGAELSRADREALVRR